MRRRPLDAGDGAAGCGCRWPDRSAPARTGSYEVVRPLTLRWSSKNARWKCWMKPFECGRPTVVFRCSISADSDACRSPLGGASGGAVTLAMCRIRVARRVDCSRVARNVATERERTRCRFRIAGPPMTRLAVVCRLRGSRCRRSPRGIAGLFASGGPAIASCGSRGR